MYSIALILKRRERKCLRDFTSPVVTCFLCYDYPETTSASSKRSTPGMKPGVVVIGRDRLGLFEGNWISLVIVAVGALCFVFLHALEDFAVIAVGIAVLQKLGHAWSVCFVGWPRSRLETIGEIPTGSQRQRNRCCQSESSAGGAIVPDWCGCIAWGFGRATRRQFGRFAGGGGCRCGGFWPGLLKLGLEEVREELIELVRLLSLECGWECG